MKDRYFRPITVECIDPAYFPEVALFVKNNGNYILYKNHDRKFTELDRARLQRTNSDFLYVRAGDMDLITEYLEDNLHSLLARNDISNNTKGIILYQTAANYVTDVLDSPEKVANLARCRSLIRHLMKYVANSEDSLKAFQAIIANNYYIFVHSVQVAALTMLAHDKLFDLNTDEMIDVGMGALLHDFGMIFISSDILEKPDALSDIEYHKVKQHTQKGYDFLKGIGVFNDVSLTIVRHHHEKYDGNGYPTGLKGDNIPRSAQLAALCDTYCAMTTERPYRKGLSHADAIRVMRDKSSGAFNVELFKRFEAILSGRTKAEATS
ncbi:HD-GYP domain-containing protein [Geobacter argillaceus]|uniref:Metal dependent phosphohydrolase n=1 Tax=Geobacter argillaceus TaxID=345631 RepID=A0A562VMG1_9BACT|nr:HD domain-containing phosphohydrolase [Geobacter argillaceus]TWJ18964.1 metal dependent phosphohydrolase [Geobacter argillaceus]